MDKKDLQEKSHILEQCFEAALEQVLFLKTLHVENFSGASCREGERAVAALEFSGDFKGRIYMVLKEEQIAHVTELVKRIFHVDAPMEHGIVFSEILNIYAGCLITQVRNIGLTIDIQPPINLSGEAQDELDLSHTRIVKMITDGEFMFKFCFVFR